MFGYIKPFKPELKVKEFDTYKAVYCGLCKQLGKSYGVLSRFVLSYDLTFLAMINSGLSEQCVGYEKCRCIAPPFAKKTCLCSSEDLSFSADILMIMSYYKVKDNIADKKLFGKLVPLCVLPFSYFAYKKAKKNNNALDKTISQAMFSQYDIEKMQNPSIDMCAEPTSKSLGNIFEILGKDEKQKKVLYRLGYLVGRYIYLTDALDDLKSDTKKNNFNPYLRQCKSLPKTEADFEQIRDYAVGSINFTIAQIANAYELLELYRYKSILDNIIYLGLHDTLKQVCIKNQYNSVITNIENEEK